MLRCARERRSEAIAGLILPMGQHKGYAIAVLMDMLSGVLTGSAFGSNVHGPYQAEHKSGAGHFMIAIDIAAFQPIADFNAKMERLITELKSTPLAPGHDEIFYPGELEARNDARQRHEGLLLAGETQADLRRLANDYALGDLLPM